MKLNRAENIAWLSELLIGALPEKKCRLVYHLLVDIFTKRDVSLARNTVIPHSKQSLRVSTRAPGSRAKCHLAKLLSTTPVTQFWL